MLLVVWRQERFGKEMYSIPDIKTLEHHKLLWHDRRPMDPIYCGVSEVWARAITDDSPVYAVYAPSTNRLVILEKRIDEWVEVKIEDVKNLYGLIWRICTAYLLLKNGPENRL